MGEFVVGRTIIIYEGKDVYQHDHRVDFVMYGPVPPPLLLVGVLTTDQSRRKGSCDKIDWVSGSAEDRQSAGNKNKVSISFDVALLFNSVTTPSATYHSFGSVSERFKFTRTHVTT